MNADKHFEKALRFEQSQAKLAPDPDWESIVEGCYMSAHHFIMAALDRNGASHPQNHDHGRNQGLLQKLPAPTDVITAWYELEVLRSGNVYGGRTDIVTADRARQALAFIHQWAASSQSTTP